jgi:hypothetical protein
VQDLNKIYFNKREYQKHDAYFFYHHEGITIPECVEKWVDEDQYELIRAYRIQDGDSGYMDYRTVAWFDTFEDAFSFIKGAYA